MSYTDVAEMHFRANPNQWLYWTEFAQRCGRLAWRTRVSECRKRGLTIENKLDKDSTGLVHSYYRYRQGDSC